MKPTPLLLSNPHLHFASLRDDLENDDGVHGTDPSAADSFAGRVDHGLGVDFAFAGLAKFIPAHQAWHGLDAAVFAAARGSGLHTPTQSIAGPAAPAERITASSFAPAGSLHFSPLNAAAPQPPEPALSQALVDAFEIGFARTLTAIQGNLETQVFAEDLPVIGDNLQAASGGAAQLQYVKALKTAIVDGLGTLTGAAEYSESQIEGAINAKLTAAGITGTGANADLSNPTNPVLTFVTAKSFAAFNVPVEADLGLPHLDVRTTGQAQTSAAYQFNFGGGLQGNDFYLATGAGSSVFTVTTETRLPSFTHSGTLSGLPVTVTDQGTDFDGVFTVTLQDPNSDGKLTLIELDNAPVLLSATMTGGVDLRLKLATNLTGSVALPNLSTDLRIDWDFTAANAVVNPADQNADFGSIPAISFANNQVNLGSFFDGFAGRILDEIHTVTGPMQPVIDVLTAPIPILSDLGSSKVTLLQLLGVSPSVVSAVAGLNDIASLAQAVDTFTGNSGVFIQLGSLNLTGDLRSEVLEDIAVTLGSTVNLRNQNANLNNFLTLVESLGGGGLSFPILTNPLAIGNLFIGQNPALFEYAPAPLVFGPYHFDQYFPVLGIAGVTLGGNLAFSAQFDFGFDTQGVRDFVASGDAGQLFNGFFVRGFDDGGEPLTSFTISAGVTAGLQANIGIANAGVDGDLTATITFGFDTSLDPDGDGKIRGDTLLATPVGDLFDPTGVLTTGLRAYLEIGIDPISKEFSFESPRIVLLDYDGGSDTVRNLGDFGADNKLYLNVGPRSGERIYGNLEDISENFEVTNGILPITGDPALIVTAFKDVNFYENTPVEIVAHGGEHSDRLTLGSDVTIPAVFFGGLSRDILTGGAANDILYGEEGPDVLDGNGGADILRGGPGSDRLIGGPGADVLDGGDAGDVAPFPMDIASYVTAAGGVLLDLRNGVFTGDAVGDTYLSIEGYEGSDFDDTIRGDDTSNRLLSGLKGNDTIEGWGGHDVLDGGEGNDSLAGGDGDDFLTGGPGADQLAGGPGVDTVAYMSSKTPVTVDLALGQGLGGDAQGDVLSGVEILFGAPLPFGLNTAPNAPVPAGGIGDQLYGDALANFISGLAGPDFIEGRGGNDLIYGDYLTATPTGTELVPRFNNDSLDGGAGDDELFGQADDDTLIGGPGNDLLDGGPGNDLLNMFDAAGIDHAEGGPDFDALSADFSTQTVAILWDDRVPTPFLFADGRSAVNFETLKNITTSTGNDLIYLAGPYPAASGDPGARFKEFNRNSISTGAGNDMIYAGAMVDFVDAGEGDDFVHGGAGEFSENTPGETPFPRFNSFSNAVEGVIGNTLHGGPGIDTLSFEGQEFYINGGNHPTYGVKVNLATNATGRAATGTTISGFENVIGTDAADDLIGDAGPNVFNPLRGGGGYIPFGGGPDNIDGVGGVDTLVIDFTRFDPPALRGVVTNGSTINRISDSPSVSSDAYNYYNIEQLQITGASKGDLLYSSFQGGADVLLGLGGNDTLGGNGGADTLRGGEGNDILTAQGTFQPAYGGTAGGHDVIEGGAGDDLVEDIASFSTPTLTADALFQLDGGTDFDTLSANFANQTAAIVWTSAAPVNVEFADGAYFRNFEQLRYFITGSGNDSITQLGRVNNDFRLGAGDDVVNPGLGVDANVDGGAGSDLAILDFSVLDTPDLAGVTMGGIRADGGEYRRALVSDPFNQPDKIFVFGFERVQVTGTSKGDIIYGTAGNDTLIGLGGNDTLNGNDGGNNYLDGGDGNDVLTGGDPLYGGGNDTILGGDGNDTITPRNGSDTVFGGAGDDLISNTGNPSGSYGTDVIDAGDGDDTVVNIFVNGSFTYAGTTTRMKLEGGAGFDRLSADFGDKTQAIVFTGGQSNSVEFSDGSYLRNFERLDNFISGSGHDVITQPGRLNNSFSLGAGNDTLNPGLGLDTVYGGAGDDLLILDYSLQDDANLSGVTVFATFTFRRTDLSSGAVVDSVNRDDFDRFHITGGSKADNLLGGSGVDTLIGGGGNDTLDGSSGADVMTGGTGDDLYFVQNAADSVIEQAGEGTDTVQSSLSGYALPAHVENLTLASTTANGSGNAENNLLIGNSAANNLAAGGGDDTIDPRRGLDTVDGGAGNDLLIVDYSANSYAGLTTTLTDAVAGNGFYNALTSASASDRITFSNIERVQITGTSFNDNLRGLAGNDTLNGGLGNDTLDGGAGADTMNGGAGDDTYLVDSIADIISENAGAGNDTVNAIIDYNLGPNLENLALGGRAVQGTGNALANIITGNARDNVLDGGDGNDVLTGGFGSGLAGSQEIDRLNGGAGADTFILGDAGGRFYDDRSSLTPGVKGYAQIDDFTPSQGDRLKLKGAEAEYFIGASPVAGAAGTALFHDSDLDGLLDPAHDELLAVLASPETLDFQHVIHDAIFV